MYLPPGFTLQATRRQYIIYLVFYLLWGFVMNSIGKLLQIAEFTYWWQVIPCYVFYLIPVSLLLRNKTFGQQYAFGMVFLAPLELLGFALGTSIAHDGNFIDQILGERNFTLTLVVVFACIPIVGNAAVQKIESVFFPE